MRALYAFCFAPPELDVADPSLNFDGCGWEDPIVAVPVAGLRAVVSACPMERFTGPAAETRLADLEWVLPRAAAHDRVIARVMTAATVFPLPFGTLFSATAALAVEAAGRRRTLLDFFARMAGREEWAVKALLDREQATEARLGALYPQAEDESAGGRGYLLRQRRRLEAERAITPWLSRVIVDLDTELRRTCEAVVIRPARDPAVANRACLLPAERAPALREAIGRLASPLTDSGLDLHCTGPWPLYSFCSTP
jgi:hypothetical protein